MANNKGLGLFVAFTLGGFIGAGLALLYAPQSGDRTRRKIVDAVEDAKDEILDYADKLKARMG